MVRVDIEQNCREQPGDLVNTEMLVLLHYFKRW